jgi:hypothetical protein
MFTTLKITKIVIDHIDKVEVGDMETFRALGYSQQSITLWTTEGEEYELILEADTPEQLAFKTFSDWLTPKLYKGKSMPEEEMENT